VRAGWTSKPIGDVFKVVNGGTPKTGIATYWDGPHSWITPAEMGNLDTPYISESRRTLTDEGLRTGAELVPAGSIILSSRAPIGHLVINEIPMAFNQGCKGLIPSPAIVTKYAYYFLLTNVPLLESLGTGATFKELSGGKLKEVPFHYPELEEQKRIVALLDEAFADIATAKTNAEKNLQNARELFESYIDEVLGSQASDYIATTLGTEVDLVAGFAFSSSRYSNNENDIRLLRGDNIMQGYLRWEDVKRWPTSDSAAHDKFALKEGDVVLAMDRPWVKAGLKRAQVTATDLPCLQVQRTARLRPKQNLSADFLFQLTGSKAFSRHLLDVQTGIGVPHISGAQIQDFKFMRPPLAKQDMIATQLQKLQEEMQCLESIYRQKLTALDNLKKSLLHQAFSGQL